jgi:hypothetical protein
MKILFRSALVAAGLVIASAGTASAQLTTTMKFTTTFPFMVGHHSMPAGAYTVRPMEGDHSLLELTNGHSSVLMYTEKDSRGAGPRQDEVIFAKHGDTYVLREVWDASTASGAEAIETHAAHTRHDAKAR